MHLSTPLLCPCGSKAIYTFCCGKFHIGDLYLQAPDAQALMRSRYSAFVLNELDYLLATWHPTTRPAQLAPNEPGLKWLGLEIKRYTPLDATHATVEFVARNKLAGRAYRLHETSAFVRENDQWFYVDFVTGVK
jgi:SEC-C motif-containing protein